jgi:mono/diheme cytochrome c family protein
MIANGKVHRPLAVMAIVFLATLVGSIREGSTLPANPPRAARTPAEIYQDVYSGWKWWHVYCYRCHGVDAVGTTNAPNLTDPTKKLSDMEFLNTVRTGIPDKMQAWTKLLDDKQIGQIHLYVQARADKVLPPGRPDENGPNGAAWVPPARWPAK